MIYLIDNGYRTKSALKTLVHKIIRPEVYKKCLGCKAKVKVEVNQGTCLACHEQSSFADDDDNINQGACLSCHEQSSFAGGKGTVNVKGKYMSMVISMLISKTLSMVMSMTLSMKMSMAISMTTSMVTSMVMSMLMAKTLSVVMSMAFYYPHYQMIPIVIVMTQFDQRAINI